MIFSCLFSEFLVGLSLCGKRPGFDRDARHRFEVALGGPKFSVAVNVFEYLAAIFVLQHYGFL